ncbi:ABC transporter substrate-binding protein [Chloroflexi bacterium TSY]|nr:ABC transporter substrate-binding protein [Chloroflexi bacterium TSY]
MNRRWSLSIPLLLILALLASACGTPPIATDPAASSGGGEAAASVPAGLDDIPRNRTLIMAGLGGEHPGGFTDVELFNPFSAGLSRSGHYQACTEGLFYYNMIGDEFIPWLAESFEYNDDFTAVTVTVRDGTTWSDGEAFDANDIVFTLNSLLENSDLSRAGQILDTVASVELVDDKNILINLTGTNPRFIFDNLTFRVDLGVPMVPEHVFSGQEDLATFSNYDPEQGWPLCTGPYELVATTVEQKVWDVREDWWGAATGFDELPKVERLIFLPGMNEITMAQMEINNEIDMAFSLTANNLQLVQSENPNIITHSDEQPFGYLDWWPISLGFNTEIAPFDDPEIRWAMSYSINRDELIQFAFKNTTTEIKLPYPAYPGLLPYFESISDLLEEYNTTEYNLDKAAAIMESKGYSKDAEGMWVDGDGNPITFEIITFPQHPSTTPMAPVVSEQLRRAGYDASFLLPADFVSRIFTGEAHAFLWGHGGSMRDPYTTLERLYHIKHVKPTGESIPATNLYRWPNQEFSDIVDQMRPLPSGDPQIEELFRKAMEIWLPNLPDIMLAETVILLPMNTTYWTNWPNPDNPYIHEGFWHRTALHIFLNLEPVQ